MPRNVNSSSSAEARDSRSYQSSSYPPISDDTDSMANGAEHVGKMFPQVSYILQSTALNYVLECTFDCVENWTFVWIFTGLCSPCGLHRSLCDGDRHWLVSSSLAPTARQLNLNFSSHKDRRQLDRLTHACRGAVRK